MHEQQRHDQHRHDQQGHDKRGFDAAEPRAKYIAVLGVGLVLALAAIILGVQWYFDRVKEQQIFVKQLEPVSEDLKTLRAREAGELHQYRYIDREKGMVRIPIERAMELIVKDASGVGTLPVAASQAASTKGVPKR